MIQRKEIVVCDYCEQVIENSDSCVSTLDVANEGYSTIDYQGKSYDVGGQHYCTPVCLVKHILKELKWKEPL